MKFVAQIKRISWHFITCCVCLLSFNSFAIEWPQEVDTAEGTVTVYQPQPEKLEGNNLTARAAMSFTIDNKDPIFGVFWFTAKIDTDRSADTVTVRDMNVTKVHWPDSKDAGEQRFTTAVNNAIAETKLDTSLSQLTASLESAEAAEQSLADLKNEAPKIVFSDKLAVLLSFDGEPKFGDIDNSSYERVLNTSMAVARDKKSKMVYLTSGETWYQSEQVTGPYSVTTTPPTDLVKMMPKPEQESSSESSIPSIVVATEPTELIATDGKANWKSLTGGELMYVENTETPWLRELSSNNMYVLLSGRWFQAKDQQGPWEFVRADQLPASFADIAPESDLGGLRVSVAGTEEADEALLDAKIPQTAAINRKDTSLTVTYDGQPKFAKIDGTSLSYAVNTDAQVIVFKEIYYAVDNAVWFKADNATGPWQVADEIPKNEIAKIPASSPLYNITYVDIYESTPDIVYVGYYPGYMWSYPYYGVPVYGTGWYYPPYWGGGFYYPRPPTWGFNAGYNNWSGWHFGMSWGNGFFNVGMNWNAGYHGGHPPHHPNGMHGGHGPLVINNGNINIGNHVNIGDHNHNGGHFSAGGHGRFDNLYNKASNIKRNASATQIKENLKTARASHDKKPNNVFADKDGSVVKLEGDKWQQRNEGKWQDLDEQTQQKVKDKVATVDASQIKEKISNADASQIKNKISTVDASQIKNKISTVDASQVKTKINNVDHEQVRSNIQTKSVTSSHNVNPSHTTRQIGGQSSQRVQHLNKASHARKQGVQRQKTRQIPRSMPHRAR